MIERISKIAPLLIPASSLLFFGLWLLGYRSLAAFRSITGEGFIVSGMELVLALAMWICILVLPFLNFLFAIFCVVRILVSLFTLHKVSYLLYITAFFAGLGVTALIADYFHDLH